MCHFTKNRLNLEESNKKYSLLKEVLSTNLPEISVLKMIVLYENTCFICRHFLEEVMHSSTRVAGGGKWYFMVAVPINPV